MVTVWNLATQRLCENWCWRLQLQGIFLHTHKLKNMGHYLAGIRCEVYQKVMWMLKKWTVPNVRLTTHLSVSSVIHYCSYKPINRHIKPLPSPYRPSSPHGVKDIWNYIKLQCKWVYIKKVTISCKIRSSIEVKNICWL